MGERGCGCGDDWGSRDDGSGGALSGGSAPGHFIMGWGTPLNPGTGNGLQFMGGDPGSAGCGVDGCDAGDTVGSGLGSGSCVSVVSVVCDVCNVCGDCGVSVGCDVSGVSDVSAGCDSAVSAVSCVFCWGVFGSGSGSDVFGAGVSGVLGGASRLAGGRGPPAPWAGDGDTWGWSLGGNSRLASGLGPADRGGSALEGGCGGWSLVGRSRLTSGRGPPAPCAVDGGAWGCWLLGGIPPLTAPGRGLGVP